MTLLVQPFCCEDILEEGFHQQDRSLFGCSVVFFPDFRFAHLSFSARHIGITIKQKTSSRLLTHVLWMFRTEQPSNIPKQ